MQYGKNNGMALKLVGKPAREGLYGFAALKNKEALKSKFNTGQKKLRANGQYDKKIEHYLGNGSAESQKTAAGNRETTDRRFIGLLKANWSTLMDGLRETMVLTIVAIAFATLVGILIGA